MLVWAALFAATSRLKARVDVDLVRFLFLIAVSRLTMASCVPFEALYADMLRTIDRSLGLLLAGAFPYIAAPPPPMPYWPLTFLSYLPTRLMGWDMRATNVAFDMATVAVAIRFGIDRRQDPSRAITARLSLPVLMLYRSWAGFSIDTQYPISVLFAVLFAAVWRRREERRKPSCWARPSRRTRPSGSSGCSSCRSGFVGTARGRPFG